MCFVEIDIDRGSSIDSEEGRRFLDRIIANRDDEIRLGDRLMDIVSLREGRCPEILRKSLIDDSFPHLRGEKWDMIFRDKIGQIFRDLFPVCPCTDEDDRSFRSLDLSDEFREHFLIYDRTTDFLEMSRDILDSNILSRDILRELDRDDSRTL